MSLSESSYSRVPAGIAERPPTAGIRSTPRATTAQKAIELALFSIFGLTIALAGVALYATNRPAHQLVPNHVPAGLKADRVNILLIGASPGRPRATTDLRTESLMLLSVQPSTGKTALTSIPVDLWVKAGRYGRRPLHSVNAVGNGGGYPGAGIGLTVDTIETILDEPIHGYARLGIGDVARLVDRVEGIPVQVKRGVYETRGDRHRFRRGPQRLLGTAAMHYAYAGSVAGIAADRFERQQRQCEVAVATLTGVLSAEIETLEGFRPALGTVAATNLTPDQISALAQAARRGGEIRTVTWKSHVDVVEVSSVAYRGEAVQPRGGDYTGIRRLMDTTFEAGPIAASR